MISPPADGETLWTRFSRVAGDHGARTAIRDDGRELTYRELAAAARTVAAALAALGRARPRAVAKDGEIGPGWEYGPPVALLLEQGIPFVTALLGVLGAGRFYVPLDAHFPASRLRLLLDDAAADVLITSRAILAATGVEVPRGVAVLDLDDVLRRGDGASPPERAVDGDAPAVILYTSGSTGRPKGVVHTQCSLMHNMLRHAGAFEFRPDDRQSLVYPCTVYGAARDTLNALLNGASLHRYPLERAGVAPLPAWIRDEGITIYCSVATVFRQMVRALDGPGLPSLRLIKLGGEVVFRSDVELLRRHFPGTCRLSCGLAATEVGAIRQVFVDGRTPMPEARVSCGQAIDGVETRIVDGAGRDVPPGAEGEIVVRSRYIARGYWRRPELTAAAFPRDPRWGADPAAGVRIYRTGDLGRLLPDGQLAHVGRADRQVKLHGNRIELAEIEAVLSEAPDVREVAVVARAGPGGHARLAAYVVASGAGARAERLREHAAARLPAFMVPATMDLLERLPLLPNGKLDRQALPDPRDPPGGRGDAATPTEAALLELWRGTLGPALGVHDGFFESGGDSLLMLELLVRMERRCGVRLGPGEFLAAPTVAAMARRIDAGASVPEVGGARALVPIQPRGSRPPLYFAAPAGGGVLAYYGLAHRLGADQPLYGLQLPLPGRAARPAADLPALAAEMVRELRAFAPRGPYRLGGWSFGGFLAFEMARQLEAAGLPVARLVVVDSDPAVFQEPPSLRRTIETLGLLLGVARNAGPFLREVARLRRRGGQDRAGAHLIELRAPPWRILAQIRAHLKLLRAYRPGPSSVDVDFIRPASPAGRARRPALDAAARWRGLTTGRVREHTVTGDHLTLLAAPHVDALAEAIGACLAPEPASATGAGASART